MWGHSMGGHITLRAMVVKSEIKAAVVWAGQVGTLAELYEQYLEKTAEGKQVPEGSAYLQTELVDTYGKPEENPTFWAAITPNSYLTDVGTPMQLHHGTGDDIVNYEQSKDLSEDLQAAGKSVEYYEYPGDNHDLSHNFEEVAKRSVEYFNRYLK